MDNLIKMAQNNALLAVRVALVSKMPLKEIDAVEAEARILLAKANSK